MVTVAVVASVGEPSSLTCTWSEKLRSVSKSRALESLTVISPVALSMAKALPGLPPTIA